MHRLETRYDSEYTRFFALTRGTIGYSFMQKKQLKDRITPHVNFFQRIVKEELKCKRERSGRSEMEIELGMSVDVCVCVCLCVCVCTCGVGCLCV